MKILKKILLIIILSFIFLISINKDDKISYVSIGDGLSKGINYNNYEGIGFSDYISNHIRKSGKLKMYSNNFSNTDERITDLIDDINENISTIVDNNKITIQNAIKNADVLTISIGMNEILYKYSSNVNDGYMYSYIDECMNDMVELIELITKLNNKNIYLLGFYNPINDVRLDKFIKYSNDKLIEICNNNNITYVNLYDIFKSNKHMIYNLNNYYPNQDGYKLIANEIIKMLNFSK